MPRWTNPETGSDIEVDGDDVTFAMTLPTTPVNDDDED